MTLVDSKLFLFRGNGTSEGILLFQETVNVGVAKSLSLDDLAEIMPDVASSLQNILEYEGDVETDMYMTFQISVGEYGKIKTVDLKPNGEDIPVTNDNR